LVARRVFGGVLSLAVFEVSGLHENVRAVRAAVRTMSVDVVHADDHRESDLARPRRPPFVAHVANDDRAIAKASWERWFSPIRTRSTNPNALLSQATASRTSG
jgi:hypothetical protein